MIFVYLTYIFCYIGYICFTDLWLMIVNQFKVSSIAFTSDRVIISENCSALSEHYNFTHDWLSIFTFHRSSIKPPIWYTYLFLLCAKWITGTSCSISQKQFIRYTFCSLVRNVKDTKQYSTLIISKRDLSIRNQKQI